jgi:hypothetical protein
MRKNCQNLLFALLALILLTLGCDGGSKVVGHVYDADNKPVENASVRFERIEKGKPESAYKCESKTDNSGKFSCGFVHEPFEVKLKLIVSKDGYKTYDTQFTSGEAREKADNGGGFRIVLERAAP